MLLTFRVMFPLLLRVTVCDALDVPTAIAENETPAGLRVTTGPDPKPSRVTAWGEPAASSCNTIEPDLTPASVGVKITDKVQLPAAGTLVPQLSDSAKSPLAPIDAMESGALSI